MAEDLESDVVVVQADMTSPKDIRLIVEQAITEFGRIDILLANAGIYISGDIIDWRARCLGPIDQHQRDRSFSAGPCGIASFADAG